MCLAISGKVPSQFYFDKQSLIHLQIKQNGIIHHSKTGRRQSGLKEIMTQDKFQLKNLNQEALSSGH